MSTDTYLLKILLLKSSVFPSIKQLPFCFLCSFDIRQTSLISSNENFSAVSGHGAPAALCSGQALNASAVFPGDALSAGTAPSLQ